MDVQPKEGKKSCVGPRTPEDVFKDEVASRKRYNIVLSALCFENIPETRNLELLKLIKSDPTLFQRRMDRVRAGKEHSEQLCLNVGVGEDGSMNFL